ncbi:carboxypeptidase-like regulatory domain-containing protein [Pedobacter aquatilis]|uniref:carboxypeptidase-like regulatory domain-containing protein n=1 Tax=Pedobacter aquatilis TaxID=351343 RepID=UPI00292F26DC|nr:carboxypeptidase-like regulatory domain-containing protein [Pedobacter aquatilis]
MIKIITIFIFFILTSINTFSQNTFSITGKVKDNKDVLSGVGVFVSGYKIATVTNNDGTYSLSLKAGSYDILFQSIGYKTLVKNIVVSDKIIVLDVVLEEDTKQLNEITIKPDPNRGKYINLFTDLFLGTTPNAAQCKIINPNVLIVDYNQDDSKMTVKTTQFLIIENKALGYRIKYQLDLFEWNGKTNVTRYEGYPYYEDLNGSYSQTKRWTKKRDIAYFGSSNHFFSSLFSGKSKEEGFIINKMKKQVDRTRPSDSLINAKIKYFRISGMGSVGKHRLNPADDDSLNHWTDEKYRPKQIAVLHQQNVMPETLVETYNESIKSINFSDVISVVYTNEKEEPSYLNDAIPVPRPSNMLNYQVSLINLLASPVYFYENGGIQNPRSIMYEGYWAWEKIADSVPLDYQPEKPVK